MPARSRPGRLRVRSALRSTTVSCGSSTSSAATRRMPAPLRSSVRCRSRPDHDQTRRPLHIDGQSGSWAWGLRGRRPGRPVEPCLGPGVRRSRLGRRGHGRARCLPALRRRQSPAPRGGDDRARDGSRPCGPGGTRDLQRAGGAAARHHTRGDAVASAGCGGATVLRRDGFAHRRATRQSRRAGLDCRHPA